MFESERGERVERVGRAVVRVEVRRVRRERVGIEIEVSIFVDL